MINETGPFWEIVEQIASDPKIKYELLELHYEGLAFGSGVIAYRIKGQIVRVVLDGRENEIVIYLSPKHTDYQKNSYGSKVYTGKANTFLSSIISDLVESS